MKTHFLVFIISIGAVAPAISAEREQDGNSSLVFARISGTCQGRTGGPLWGTALSWDRHDLSWQGCEPRKGEWNEAYLKRFGERILAHHTSGAQLLPVLGYNAGWSWDRSRREVVYNRERRTFIPQEDGSFEILYEKQGDDGSWIEQKREISTGKCQWPLAAENVRAWESYVRRSVTFLMAPPYNLKYFQIWNEAHPSSGFWVGDLDSYMTRVHLPAARVIRELGGKVVYGGWPSCGSLDEFIALLDKHDAWKSLDVVDVHYFGLQAFDRLSREAAERGFPDMGVWQTEICFHDDASFISTVYPRFLDWSLRNGWNEQALDRYKLFFFAYWSPDDVKAYGYRKTLLSGERLSPHGQSLQTLGDLFGREKISLYENVESEPRLSSSLDGRKSALEAFKAGQRIVIAVQWVDEQKLSLKSFTIRLPELSEKDITGIERREAAGWRRKLEWHDAGNSGVDVEIPILDRTDFRGKLRDSERYAHGFYIVVTLRHGQ